MMPEGTQTNISVMDEAQEVEVKGTRQMMIVRRAEGEDGEKDATPHEREAEATADGR